MKKMSLGLARMHQEPGERRDFLPGFVASLSEKAIDLVLEHDYGSGIGFSESDYLAASPRIRFADLEEVYNQDIVLVLRYPGDEKVCWMQPGACLVSMLHYPTRPLRVEFLKSRGIECVSLDSVKDDLGRRLVENLRAVAWNGVETAFKVLAQVYPSPGIEDPNRNPIKVTVMGAGAVGMFAIQAGVRYGHEPTWKKMAAEGVTGVQITAVEYDLTNHPTIMTQIIRYTDILIDATQRPDPTRPIIPNQWLGNMRPYAVLLDLSVDPYECTAQGLQMVKGIEGIPQGNLDQYIFSPDDPAWDNLPECIDTHNRRWAVSCYSWPGVHPNECMEVYGKQIEPLLATIVDAGGVKNIQPNGDFFHRAITRARL